MILLVGKDGDVSVSGVRSVISWNLKMEIQKIISNQTGFLAVLLKNIKKKMRENRQ